MIAKPLYIPMLPAASFSACMELVNQANRRGRVVCGRILGDVVTARPGDDPHHVFCDAGWYPCSMPDCINRKALRSFSHVTKSGILPPRNSPF